jgi:acetaldehyde dehydrogenase (acetylating)
LTLRDTDLISIQEARAAVERAHVAQQQFAKFSQSEVDAIVDACAAAATEAGEQLARTAVEETGYGNVADKTAKNRLASVDVHRAIRRMKTVGIVREDREKAIVEVAEPFGVVAAIIPCTNPTSTAIYKTLIALKSRNAIVLSPHPSAMRCICEAAGILERAALNAGAPDGIIVCLNHPTMQGTQELMKHRRTGVILATGGTGLVRAAYSSGKPAYGVGPGNVPALIEHTADVKKAVADIFAGKTFDYGTICSSEQAIVTEDSIRDEVLEECRNQGGHFLSEEEIRKVGDLVFRPGTGVPDPKIVGKHATVLAELAGIQVPPETRVLIARLVGVGREFPLSAEKLSPILAFYSAENFPAATEICRQILHHGGAGHTASIHTQSEAAALEYGQKVPASRVCVNTSAVHGSIGYSTNLFPAMTLGCGSAGGNITSDNIGPQHLMNLKRIAWESRGVEHKTIPADQRLAGRNAVAATAPAATAATTASPTTATGAGRPESTSAKMPNENTESAAKQVVPDRQTIAKIVERVFMERGIARGSGATNEQQSAPNENQQTPAEVAAAAVAERFAPSSKSTMTFANPPAPSKPTQQSATPQSRSEVSPSPSPKPSIPEIKIADFVSENDIRVAMTKQQKIFINPKTIVTPAARDLGDSHDVLIMTAA